VKKKKLKTAVLICRRSFSYTKNFDNSCYISMMRSYLAHLPSVSVSFLTVPFPLWEQEMKDEKDTYHCCIVGNVLDRLPCYEFAFGCELLRNSYRRFGTELHRQRELVGHYNKLTKEPVLFVPVLFYFRKFLLCGKQ